MCRCQPLQPTIKASGSDVECPGTFVRVTSSDVTSIDAKAELPPVSIHQERESHIYMSHIYSNMSTFFHGMNTLTSQTPSYPPPPSPAYPSSPRPAPAPTVPPDSAAAAAAVVSADDTWTPNFRPTHTMPIHPAPSRAPSE